MVVLLPCPLYYSYLRIREKLLANLIQLSMCCHESERYGTTELSIFGLLAPFVSRAGSSLLILIMRLSNHRERSGRAVSRVSTAFIGDRFMFFRMRIWDPLGLRFSGGVGLVL